MKCSFLFFMTGLAVSALPVVGFSQTVLSGDHVIEPGLTDTGSLIVSGDLQIEGNRTDFGTTGEGHAALLMSYLEEGHGRQVVVYASKDTVDYLWKQDGGGGWPRMSLGEGNTLSLYDASGVETITLSPITGDISIAGEVSASGLINAYGGVRLLDGTLLSSSHSLRSTALYNIGGEKVAEVLEDGTIAFGGGIVLGGVSGAKLTEKSVNYLSGVLQNFGYRENEPTEVDILLGNSSGGSLLVSLDSFGNRYVAGAFSTLSIRLGSLQLNRVSGVRSWFVVKYSSEGDVLWSQVWAVPSNSILTGLAVNGSGDFCLSGSIPTSLGATLTLAGVSATGTGGMDGVLLRANSSGAGQWLRVFGGPDVDYVRNVTLDDDGNVYAAGDFKASVGGDVNLGGVAKTASGGIEGFFAKLDSTGTVLWVLQMGAIGTESTIRGITADASGDVYIAGLVRNASAVTRNLLGHTVQFRPSQDGFVIKTNGLGVPQWAKSFGSSQGFDGTHTVQADPTGGVYVLGTINRTAPVSLTLAGFPVQTSGASDGFILKLDASGTGQWVHMLGTTGVDSVKRLALDTSGNAYLIGSMTTASEELVSLAGIPFEVSAGTTDYILKLDDSGAGQWVKGVSAALNGIAYAANGNLIVSGLSGETGFILGTQRIQPSSDFIAEFPSASQPHDEVIFDGVSFAWGNAKALGTASIALGGGARAEGDNSVSLGRNAVASADNAVAIGAQASATGWGAAAIGGGDNVAEGAAAVIVGGSSNHALGSHASIVGGVLNYASGFNSLIAGSSDSIVHGSYSAIIGGSFNYITGESSIILGGLRNLAVGKYSVAAGLHVSARAAYSVVIGSANVSQGHSTDWISTDDLFVVGNGDPSQEGGELSNAFVVHKDGTTRSAGVIESKRAIRVPPSGDIPMGAFTAGSNPATLGAGLRYTEE